MKQKSQNLLDLALEEAKETKKFFRDSMQFKKSKTVQLNPFESLNPIRESYQLPENTLSIVNSYIPNDINKKKAVGEGSNPIIENLSALEEDAKNELKEETEGCENVDSNEKKDPKKHCRPKRKQLSKNLRGILSEI